jgi:hypothetical protein
MCLYQSLFPFIKLVLVVVATVLIALSAACAPLFNSITNVSLESTKHEIGNENNGQRKHGHDAVVP